MRKQPTPEQKERARVRREQFRKLAKLNNSKSNKLDTMKTLQENTVGNLEVRLKRSDEKPLLVSFGKAGHTVYFEPNRKLYSTSREQGYDDPETFFAPSKWWAHDYLTQRDAGQFEDCLWVDVRKAVETPEGYSWVFKGPLCDVNAKDSEIVRCPQPSDLMAGAMASDPSNQFGQLLTLYAAQKSVQPDKANALDSVSPARFVLGWIEHGASGGIIRNAQFVPLTPK